MSHASAESTSVLVRSYRDEDEPAVLELLQASLGGGPTGRRTAAFFRWKHVDNVFGRSLMLVAEADDAIVGLRAFMRWAFVVDGRRLSAVRAVDTATHPAHQGKGIFSRLTLEALELLRAEGVDLVFNTPNGKSLPGYLKMGWKPVGRFPVRIRVRHPVRFGRGARGALSGAETATPMGDVTGADPAAALLREGLGLEALLGARRVPAGRLATPVDADYLRWRYADAPELGYHVVLDAAGGGLRGFAIFRARSRGALREATVAELMVRPGEERTIGSLLARVGRASKADHLALSPPAGAPESGSLLRRRAVTAPRGMTLVVNPLREGIEPSPEALSSWSLGLGDVEVF
ncbi:MAG TPA: GNAT family N-acetyltransferase [Actinomycetota bacterium]